MLEAFSYFSYCTLTRRNATRKLSQLSLHFLLQTGVKYEIFLPILRSSTLSRRRGCC